MELQKISAGQKYILTPTGEGLNDFWREYQIGTTGCKMQFAFDNPSQQVAVSLWVIEADDSGFTGVIESRFPNGELSTGTTGWIEADHWALKNYTSSAS